MFLEIEELKSAVYEYQLQQITEEDDTIVVTAIETAQEEVSSYLTPNNQHQNGDGRFLYDVEAVFSATGTARNPLILAHCKTVAVWHVLQLCKVDILYEHAKERYDRAILWLRDLASGKVTLNSLPKLDPEADNVSAKEPFRFGSRAKFNYE